ncbi:hypothetical protein PF010_g30916 [Phytophthora fragariae]|uniref:DDE Tnp4 domain-containing protein n=1 Tax=Phytophthora fragariae TaxID=53985 RepID=A0A6G0JJI5_9STRA|nr:hypothetical protein PF010_g30916 [Phytophthora fragariae]
MVKEGTRAATDLLLEARALYAVLEDSSEEEDSGDGLDDISVVTNVLATRYLFRSNVLKSAKWYPARVFSKDPVRARRDLRISVDGFRFLLASLVDHPAFKRTPGKQQQAPVQLQLEVFLYSLQSLSYYQVSQYVGVGEGTIKKFNDRVVEAVLALEGSFVRWPTKTERGVISAHVQHATGFPNCIGFVDGTMFQLKYAPKVDAECYFSRKANYCLNGQIVCDHRRRVIYYQVGLPGSVHDKRAFSFTNMASDPRGFFGTNEYLLGDSAYGVSFPFIVSPYKRPAALEPDNAQFNFRLSSQRIAIEHCIGVMKGRFPFLSECAAYLLSEDDIVRICKRQRACFTLHNVCIELREKQFDPVAEPAPGDDWVCEIENMYDPDRYLSSDDLRIWVQAESRQYV